MIFHCQQNEIVNAINTGIKAISTRTTMPILECFYLEASNDELKITSNNMELGIKTTIPARVEESGTVCLNAKMLSDIIHKLPDEMIRFNINDSFMAVISCGKIKMTIGGQSGDDYPLLTEIEREKCITISSLGLKDIIRQTIFSISDNETTKVLTGEHFEVSGDELRVSACDTHRIAIRKMQLKESYDAVDVVIPGKSLIELNKILESDAEKNVNLFVTNNTVMFEMDNTIILSRLIEAKYLNINQMISNDFETKIVVNKKKLYDCLDRATLFARESERKPIIFNIYDERMALNMNSTIGTADDEIDIEKEGKNLMIGFNPKFFIDVIRAIDDEEITIYMTNQKAPCYIRSNDGSYNYLVLPVQFNASV